MTLSGTWLRVARLVSCLGVVTLATIVPARAASSVLLAANKGDQTLVNVDPVTLRVTGSYQSGPDPHELLASSDWRLAFITNYSLANTISVIDLVAHKALPSINLRVRLRPHGLAVEGHVAEFVTLGKEAARDYHQT